MIIETTGLHASIHFCRQPEHFDKLIAVGFRRNHLLDPAKTPIVESFVMSGIPAKAVKAGLYEWPN